MYQNGKGVPQDDAEAIRWYLKAAEQGNADAQNNLGLMYQTEAIKWYLKAAEQGNTGAQFNLGLMYDVPQDDSKKAISKDLEEGKDVLLDDSKKAISKAAEQGIAD
jgi:TPR repeat protein